MQKRFSCVKKELSDFFLPILGLWTGLSLYLTMGELSLYYDSMRAFYSNFEIVAGSASIMASLGLLFLLFCSIQLLLFKTITNITFINPYQNGIKKILLFSNLIIIVFIWIASSMFISRKIFSNFLPVEIPLPWKVAASIVLFIVSIIASIELKKLIISKITKIVFIGIFLCTLLFSIIRGFISDNIKNDQRDNDITETFRSQPAKLPNIIIILIDSALADYFSFYSNNGLTTPNIDELAKKSIVFSKFYPVGDSTISSISSMYSSKYPPLHGRYIWAFGSHKKQKTIFDIIRKFYNISFIGLDPSEFGFNIRSDKKSSLLSFVTDKIMRNKMAEYRIKRFTVFNFLLHTMNYFKLITFSFEFKDYMERNLSIALNEKKSLFLHVHIVGLHPPLHRKDCSTSSPRYVDKYLGMFNIPRNVMSAIEQAYKEKLFCVDKTIGNILSKIKNAGLLENSVIIITSDHNIFLGLDEKSSTFFSNKFEVPIYRAPLIIYVPWEKPKIVEKISDHVDIAPTILDLVGLPIPSWVEGRSLLPLFSYEGKQIQNKKKYALNFWIDRNIPKKSIEKGILQIVNDDGYTFVYNISEKKGKLFNDIREYVDDPFKYEEFLDMANRIIQNYNSELSLSNINNDYIKSTSKNCINRQ